MLKSEVSSESEFEFIPVPSGTYFARCVSIIDLGTQTETYEGKVSKKPRMVIIWEIPDQRTEDGSLPRTLSNWYTISLNEKANLRRDLESWRGKPFQEGEWFEYKNLMGAPCLLGVMEYTNKAGKKRNKITSVSKLPNGYPDQPQETDGLYFDLSEFDQSAFDRVGEYFQGRIQESDEWKQRTGSAPTAAKLGSGAQNWNSENPAPPGTDQPENYTPPSTPQPPEFDDDVPF